MCGINDAVRLVLTLIFRLTSSNSQALSRIDLTISKLPEIISTKGRDQELSK